jgi:hypothetical protein
MTTKKNLIYFISAALIISCAVFFYQHGRPAREEQVLLKVAPIQTVYGWGYNILANDKLYIHQEYIPAISGKKGFQSKADALKVGNLVVSKISSNQRPTISEAELKQLGIIQ